MDRFGIRRSQADLAKRAPGDSWGVPLSLLSNPLSHCKIGDLQQSDQRLTCTKGSADYVTTYTIRSFRLYFVANVRRRQVDWTQAIDNRIDKGEIVISIF